MTCAPFTPFLRAGTRLLVFGAALLCAPVWLPPVDAQDTDPAPAPDAPVAATPPGAPGSSAAAPPAADAAPAPAAPDARSGQGDAPRAGRVLTGRIAGSVMDAARRSLAGLLVKLESRTEPGLLRVTSTDAKGHYSFNDLPAGVYDVRVEADGFAPGSKERLEVRPPFRNIVDLQLAPAAGTAPGAGAGMGANGGGMAGAAPSGAHDPVDAVPVAVRGTFVDAKGRPVVEVSVVLAREGGTTIHQVFSDDDGRFVVEGVAPGRYRMLVRSLGHVPIEIPSVDVRPVNGLTLSLALADFPLNYGAHPEGSPPAEIPRPLPATLAGAPPPPAAGPDGAGPAGPAAGPDGTPGTPPPPAAPATATPHDGDAAGS